MRNLLIFRLHIFHCLNVIHDVSFSYCFECKLLLSVSLSL